MSPSSTRLFVPAMSMAAVAVVPAMSKGRSDVSPIPAYIRVPPVVVKPSLTVLRAALVCAPSGLAPLLMFPKLGTRNVPCLTHVCPT